jgi:hypothetical protein
MAAFAGPNPVDWLEFDEDAVTGEVFEEAFGAWKPMSDIDVTAMSTYPEIHAAVEAFAAQNGGG